MRRSWILLVALAACDDDSNDGRADLDASAAVICTNEPDAATALGVRGVELWDRYARVYNLIVGRQSGGAIQSAAFTVTVARSDDWKTPGLDDCTRVAVPVTVTVKSGNPVVDTMMAGVLRGSLFSADVAFATPEYQLGLESSVYGSLIFQAGREPSLSLRTDDRGSWSSP